MGVLTALIRYATICTILFSTVALQGATFHAVIICDTNAENIGPSVLADYQQIRKEFKNISLMTGMTLNEMIYSGNAINTEILRNVDCLEVGSDDVVFFYFSGHGYRTDSKNNNQWPNLYLTPIQSGIDLLDVVSILRNKRPRMILAIGDCCNNVIPENFAPPVIKVTKKALMMRSIDIMQNYKQLFLTHKGTIIMSGSIPGQVSWGSETGGFYTQSFFYSLNLEAYTSFNPSWYVILDRASLIVIQEDIGQTPQYELLVD